MTLVADRGLAQQPAGEAAAAGGCAAARIRLNEENRYIDSSVPAIFKAMRMGAAVALDVQRTADGQIVIFEDAELDCRTNGKGPVRARTLAELKTLDIGYGYTPDGGRSFPLRGRGIGAMPALEDVLREIPTGEIIFNFHGADPRDAEALVAAFARAGMKIDGKYGFHGDPRILARIKALVPAAWTFGSDAGRACLADYVRLGWTGYLPESCRETTVLIPLDEQWTLWGWPNRFQRRMAGAGTRMIIVGGVSQSGLVGLDRPEQLGEVPRDFRGHVWIHDFYALGRALGR
jgi:glycerophosphoryl diester phosphodiesterase